MSRSLTRFSNFYKQDKYSFISYCRYFLLFCCIQPIRQIRRKKIQAEEDKNKMVAPLFGKCLRNDFQFAQKWEALLLLMCELGSSAKLVLTMEY